MLNFINNAKLEAIEATKSVPNLVEKQPNTAENSGVKPHLSRYYKLKGSRLSNTIISMFVMQNYTVLNIVS